MSDCKTEKKQIKIACQGTDFIELSSLKEFQGKIKKLSKTNLNRLKESIFKYGFSAPIFIWENHTYILDGHQRRLVLLQLQSEGYVIPPIPVVTIQAKTKIEAKEKLLHITSQYGVYNLKGLQDFAKDLKIDNLSFTVRLGNINLGGDFRNRGYKKPQYTEKLELSEEIKSLLDKEQELYLSCSGGKDSVSTAFLIRQNYPKKPLHLCYVDTGAEFPDIISHIINVANILKAELHVLKPSKHIIQHYAELKAFPRALTKDCIKNFINKPLHIFLKNKTKIIIRGGRAKQAILQQINNTTGIYEQKNKQILINPLFNISAEAYEKLLIDVKANNLLWTGYDKGFIRTACWFCPFQKAVQYEAIKKYYPMLFEQLCIYRNTWQTWTNLCVSKYINQKGEVVKKC